MESIVGKGEKIVLTESPPFPKMFSKPIFLIRFDVVCLGVLKLKAYKIKCSLMNKT